MNICIVKAPTFGKCKVPRKVRKEWVGVEIPVSPNYDRTYTTVISYTVPANKAIAVLREKRPEAAKWWLKTLNDGATREAVLTDVVKGHLMWVDPKTNDVIPKKTVLGWRETYNCDAARQDIDAFARDPISIITKDHLDDAFTRHIDREHCPDCLQYYESKKRVREVVPA